MTDDELSRLRRVAQSLLAEGSRRREETLARWTSSERPALKAQAASLKASEALLLRTVEGLEARIAARARTDLSGRPGAANATNAAVFSGFNPIQSRAGPDGAPLPIPALAAERDRLLALVSRLEADAAECRAEVLAASPRRRAAEAAVWETRLVALADTLRDICISEIRGTAVVEARPPCVPGGAATLVLEGHAPRPKAVSLPGSSGAGPGAAGSGPQAPLPPIPPKASKSKMMALKFMARIGSKKEKYKGSGSAELELRHDGTPPKKSMKSLASKLLGRKSKGGAGPDSLSRASPGPSLYPDSLDARSSDYDEEEEEGGEGDGSLASTPSGSGSELDRRVGLGDTAAHPAAPLTAELVGEKGSKVPNLSIGQADVEANVFLRLSFKFTEAEGWQPGDERPLFDVQHLEHRLVGNSVPMPASLIRAILKTAIPGLIQRRLQLVLPRELGSYLLRAGTGVALTAGVDCVGPALATLDADLAYELCGVRSAGWAALARAEPALGPLDVRAFLDGPLAAVRRKPARLRVALSSLDAAFNLDAAIAAAHAYTRRALEELFVNGPLPNASEGGGDGATKEAMDEQFELLQAWHAWVSREVGHFKSKFRGAAATVLGAANCRGFTLGVENGEYEGPLKLHLPVNMELDPDGAFSFDAPLPSPTGKIGEFMDIFKALTVPSHLRPPAAAVNWVPLSGDPALDMAMREQVACGVALIAKVLDRLGEAAQREGRPGKEESAATALSNPRTLLGASLGRFIVNRLSLRVRLDERRIAEILEGMDSSTLGDQFVPTAGRILGHLGDVAESSDISRLRAEVQSLGYQSAISPAGAVRLVHAVGRAFLASFKGVQEGALAAYTARMERLYALFSREGLDLSVCCSVRAGVEAGDAVARLRGRADEVALRETSPLLLTMDVDLVALGRAMRGDP
ncbi:hypothetical protein F751_5934 [Auxenochlorella protothecoides]|uniref:Uncharacterized protein n=1 Tax=Auxenochlorella protothecoides TaxID=3075 RepID=A0A087SQ23_AUXPR|nr:hypothetical protein F751_5934 [Auxenochlorella protothecoides]KFM27827.1 hypothetical protein F751_5934 [Auxenochlorella protothecoides]